MKHFKIWIPLLLLTHGALVFANVPGGIVSGSSANVTLTSNSTGPTLSNGIVQIVCTTAGAEVNQINYTYNNGGGTKTKQLLLNGKDGGELYWEFGGFGGATWTYSVVSNPATNGGNYAEVAFTSLASGTSAEGDLQVNFSMLRGSPGFYVTLTMTHHAGDIATGLGEMRTNIYLAPDFNWMSVSPVVQRELGIGSTFVPAYDSTQEDSLCVSGVDQGTYDDKYKFSQIWGTQRVWGWGSVNDPAHGVASGANVGIWNVLASSEYYNGGPLKPELMDAPMVNMLNGGHYEMGTDSNWSANEQWTRVQGPYFVYVNNVPSTITDPIQTSQGLYNDAVAQGAAEATAWPYSWFNNSTYDANYASAAQRGTVTGTMVINDVDNPSASGSNLWVGVVQQPATADGVYDFEQWYKPYQFWVKTDGSGNFTIPAVISGTNYTLYAFGQGAAGTFMSQNQTGGNPPWSYNLPASPFSVTVTGSATTSLGNVTWTPTRVGPTVFEIGYPDRTGHKFRHGDDWWVGDIGPSPTEPSPIWTKFLEYPFDFPNGLNYTVGVNQWPTDWNFIQPIIVTPTEGNASSSATISFNLSSAPAKNVDGSLYLGLASDYYSAVVVSVNGANLGSTAGVTATPSAIPASGYIPSYANCDASIREGCNASFSDERLTFPASLLHSGSNTITLSMRQIGGSYFADHFMYDYIRLELPDYVPPPPAGVTAYAGNKSMLLSWPVTPGATSYNLLRTITSGSAYTTIAGGTGAVVGPVCGSGPANATYLDTTATNGKTYYYVVQSLNTTGTSANSPESTGVAPSAAISTAPPAAPTGLAVTGTNGNVSLTWTASPGANYYTVLRSTILDKIPTWTPTPTLTSTSTILSTITLSNTVTGPSYVDSAVTNGSKYSYAIEATNAAGTSSTSGALTAKPVPASAPGAPVVTAVPSVGAVTLKWGAVPGAVGYIIQSATAPGGPYTYVNVPTALTYGVTGLNADTTYYYTVTAVNADSVSTSSTVSATTPLGAPTGVVAIAGNTQVTLSWTAVAGATSYTVQRGSVTGGPYPTTFASAGPSYTDNGLTNGTEYFYIVAANNASGAGINSSEVNATPVASVPIAPLGLTAMGSNNKIILNWTASVGATGYTVYRASTTGGPYAAVANDISAVTFTDVGLSGNTTYYYVVVAANANGSGAYSAEVGATTLPNATATFTWDNLGASPADPADGSGSWDTATALWSNGAADSVWSNASAPIAVFGNNHGAAGTVTVGNITAGGLVFNAPGSGAYTLAGGTLTLTGTTPSITANANATIGSVLAGSGVVTMDGLGTLTLTSPATFSGSINLDAITISLNGPSFSAGMLGTATLNFNGGTLLNTTGGNNTSEFSNPVSVGLGQTGTITFSSGTGWGSATSIPAVTGSGTLNLYIGSSLAGSRDEFYPNFSAFAGQVNFIGTIANAGVQYFLDDGAAGSANAVWNLGGASSTVIVYPQTGSGGNTMNLGALIGGTGGMLAGGSAGMATYNIGGTGDNATFAGSILGNPSVSATPGNAAVTKVGSGAQILSGSCVYTGPTNVLAGILEITGSLSSTSSLSISNGAVFYLAGGSLSVSGGVTNNGTFKISGAPALTLTGSFINNGILDLINGSSTLPPNFVNNGTVINAGTVQVQQVGMTGTSFNLFILSYSEHTYQLQRSASLTNPAWTNVGSAQTGTGSTLTFTDPAAAGTQGFYQIEVGP
jgi:autotransporter-associated beta strand protein